MADVNVKQKSSTENVEKQQDQSLSKRGSGTEASRRGTWDQFGFPLTPWMQSHDLFSANPFSFMRRMSEEMDRTFGRFFGQAAGGGGLSTWYPAVEVAERDGRLQVHAELPGLKPEDVKVEVTDDALIIQGERKDEREENKSGVYRSERHYGQFYRSIPLPQGAKAEQAEAQFNNGVLEVSLPIPEAASNRRQIPINAGGSQKPASASASEKNK